MALYLPKQHLVIEVVDDPESAPIDPDAFPELSVATVTVDQLANPRTIGWYAQRAMGHARRVEAAEAQGDAEWGAETEMEAAH